jgi:O-6-methylguanine DNA methyltransferase
MAKNRVPVFIPCHRVIKADGSWGNFTGGTGIKEYLLEYESGDS